MLIACSAVTAYASGNSVDSIGVDVKFTDGQPSPRVIKRMEASIDTVGQHILLGKSLSEIEIYRQSYEKLIQEVFDRVLVGYTVDKVNIIPGEKTMITVSLTPWGEVVRHVALDIKCSGISTEAAGYVKRELGDIEEQVDEVLLGLPVDTVDWAGTVTKGIIREMIADRLPEFQASFDIVPGSETIVRLTLIPIGPTIQNVDVSLRSGTIPNILLLEAKPKILEKARILQGLPVAFVERHKAVLLEKTEQLAAEQKVAQTYGLSIEAQLKTGVNSLVIVDAETKKYKVNLEGYLDMGRKNSDQDTSAKLHAGKYIGKNDEVFMEVNFTPSNVKWEFIPGISHQLSETTFAGYKHNTSGGADILFLNHNITKDWSLRIERDLNDEHEIGLRYKLHEFLSAEYIYTPNESYIRMVGSL